MFTYIKKYPHPRGVYCKTTYSDIDVARFTAHKKKPYNLYICCKTGLKVGAGITG